MKREETIKKSVVVVFLAVLCSSPLMAELFDDGGVHDVDYTIPNTDPYGLAVDFGTTVNVLPGAWVQGGFYQGDVSAIGTVNFYGGIVDGVVYVYSSGTVTVFGSAFAQNGTPLDSSVTQLSEPDSFLLTGQYENGDPINLDIILDPGAVVYLNWPAPQPDIVIYPVSMEMDFGNIELGQSSTGIVQIYNNGNADLQVSSIALSGDAAFTISINPAPVAVAPSTTVDIEITFTPAAEGYVTSSLIITSDDPDESPVDVFLGGAGVITEIPPTQQIQSIIAFYDQSVADGTILGYGPGNSPAKRVKAMRCMLKASDHLIQEGYFQLALITLQAVDKLSDGMRCPQDFIVGENVALFNLQVNTLIEDLQEL
jgi:hypothetical protein